ncbi:unnamed protein product [Amoebophrya sp. A120]|nr:unnamed protein product [Amoebophrya sp. A120]|eukprot:GSA120T00015853001.1
MRPFAASSAPGPSFGALSGVGARALLFSGPWPARCLAAFQFVLLLYVGGGGSIGLWVARP